MNVDAKIIKKVLANKTQHVIKELHSTNNWDFSKVCKAGSAFEHQSKESTTSVG